MNRICAHDDVIKWIYFPSTSLTICAGNSPTTDEFPAQRPVTRSFNVFFDLRPNKRFRKQSWGWWFETPSRPLWRHFNAGPHMQLGRSTKNAMACNVMVVPSYCKNDHSSNRSVMIFSSLVIKIGIKRNIHSFQAISNVMFIENVDIFGVTGFIPYVICHHQLWPGYDILHSTWYYVETVSPTAI